MQRSNESLSGNFEGVGIEFNIQKDTIMVIATVMGGPAEIKGVRAGDRIIRIDGKKVTGLHITNNDVFSKLRGKKGTQVKVGVFRPGVKQQLEFTITRDRIPEKSVDVYYMIDRRTGYLKLSKFSATTYQEFSDAIAALNKRGMKTLIFDLRGNGGGFLDIATDISDEFLSGGKMIVYTEGRKRGRRDYKATKEGILEHTAVIVLIDELSASASEIVAGAIQDNDRGLIIGRRSFGKGLVQEPLELPDGSGLRLTVARYYTPTGRCIQRPYTESVAGYYSELFSRLTDGNADKKYDSLVHSNSSKKYVTPAGKVLYGGGGIRPDIVIPMDTALYTPVFNLVFNRGLINQYCFDYANRNRQQLKKQFPTPDSFVKGFTVSAAQWAEFVSFLRTNGLKNPDAEIEASARILQQYLRAFIARHIVGYEGFYPIIYQDDPVYLRAIREAQRLK
jgi:carboxyl-terminal processing protease